jgi:4-amino-4-deoxy-L-arabinose transferase-like glycosyltransferase
MAASQEYASVSIRILFNPWVLALVVITAFSLGTGWVPLFDEDEGAFSEATREMLARGDFLVTWLNGEPRHDKPILIYWVQAISVAIFGRTEFAFRLPSLLAALAWSVAVYRFTRQNIGRDQAAVATLSFVSALMISLVGKWATADALLNLFIALTMFDAWRFSEHQEPKHGWRIYLWMALGFLTKGPVALAIPIIAGGLFLLWSRRLTVLWALLSQPLGWAVFLLVAAPWYVLNVITPEGRAFLQGFFFDHNLSRFTTTREGHGGQYWYFLVLTPLLVMPFTGWLISTLRRLPAVFTVPFERFLWLWFFTVFLLFSLSATQLPHYLVYGMTPLFVLFGRYHEHFTSRWLAFTPAVLFFALLTMVPGVLDVLSMRSAAGNGTGLEDLGTATVPWFYAPATTAALVLVVVMAMLPRLRADHGLLLTGLMQVVLVSAVVAPTVAGFEQQHVRAAGRHAATLDDTIVEWSYRRPSFSVYRDAVTEHREPQPGEVVFTRASRLPALLAERGWSAEPLFASGNVLLARIQAPAAPRADELSPNPADGPAPTAPAKAAPVGEAPGADEAATEKPVRDEPAPEAPAADGAATEEPVPDEPAPEAPAADDAAGASGAGGAEVTTETGVETEAETDVDTAPPGDAGTGSDAGPGPGDTVT